MSDLTFGCRLISFLIGLTTIIALFKNAFILQKIAILGNTMSVSSIFLITLGSLLLILNIAAAIGLYFVKKWSFIITYIAIIFTTVFFSIPYIPVIIKVLPFHQLTSLLLINAALFIYTVYMHKLYLKQVNKQF